MARSDDCPELSSRIAYIYCLVDPSTDEIRYVGKADRPLDRYKEHVSRSELWGDSPKVQWLIGLRICGKTPRLRILQCVPYDIWRQAENQWISHCLAAGCGLTNFDRKDYWKLHSDIQSIQVQTRYPLWGIILEWHQL